MYFICLGILPLNLLNRTYVSIATAKIQIICMLFVNYELVHVTCELLCRYTGDCVVVKQKICLEANRVQFLLPQMLACETLKLNHGSPGCRRGKRTLLLSL